MYLATTNLKCFITFTDLLIDITYYVYLQKYAIDRSMQGSVK